MEMRDQSGYGGARAATCYPATKANVRFMGWALTGADTQMHTLLGSCSLWPLSPLFLAGALVDLPFSLVFDTVLLPADLAAVRNEKLEATTRATIAAIWSAVADFERANGRLPSVEEGLNVLAPTHMSAVPVDGWGTPFRYEMPDDKPLIRSAGSDKRFNTYPDLAEWWPGQTVKTEQPGGTKP